MADKPTSVASKDWSKLNDELRTADEDTCRRLFKEEFKGPARTRYLLRIHSRLNAVRAKGERELIKAGKSII